jgi:tRNA threonylcarbamoyladenosine biosynthesis protein TsaB
MNTILNLDTTSNEHITVSLKTNKGQSVIKQKLDIHKAQKVLPLINDILGENNLKLKDITSININPGPGSYTGIRVGLTVANTLAFLLKIPINGLPVGEPAQPRYS